MLFGLQISVYDNRGKDQIKNSLWLDFYFPISLVESLYSHVSHLQSTTPSASNSPHLYKMCVMLGQHRVPSPAIWNNFWFLNLAYVGHYPWNHCCPPLVHLLRMWKINDKMKLGKMGQGDHMYWSLPFEIVRYRAWPWELKAPYLSWALSFEARDWCLIFSFSVLVRKFNMKT